MGVHRGLPARPARRPAAARPAPAGAAGAPPSAEHASAHAAADADAATEDGPEEDFVEAGADGATEGGAEAGAGGEEPYEQRIQRSLVLVEVDIPPVCLIDGVHSRCFAGAGTPCSVTCWLVCYIAPRCLCADGQHAGSRGQQSRWCCDRNQGLW